MRDGSAGHSAVFEVFARRLPEGRRYGVLAGLGRLLPLVESFTFDHRDGKTLLTLVESGFETEADRDAFMSGTPGFVDSLERVVASRVTGTAGR